MVGRPAKYMSISFTLEEWDLLARSVHVAQTLPSTVEERDSVRKMKETIEYRLRQERGEEKTGR